MVGRKRPAVQSQATDHPLKNTLRVAPLGGMCEIGKNMTVYEYGMDLIIVDCGQSFPDETMPGVDAVIPDFTYVLQNRDRVRGIFLTHGHEDHIGALPWLLTEIKAPVYGGRMTIELVRYKLEDRIAGLSKSCDLRTVQNGQTIHCGCFGVEFIHVNHSIADASMLCIHTPVGRVMHSGDFKIDYTPIYGGIMDLQRIAELGREGVLLFVCESTNIEVQGHSVSERHVGESFASMFATAPGRIFVATFSSNVHRLQQIFTAAETLGRKVALVGRSMLGVFNVANSLGYIQMKPDTLIDINQIDNYPPERVVIISTGSQGEPMSALTRIAFASHREVEIVRGDTVIISASPIPGNEKPVYKVINELYKRGAKVYYAALADVHASGHASRDELRLVQTLVKPRYLIPAHGEYRMLYQQAELAHELGMPWENIFLLNNGDIFEISRGRARIAGFTNGAAVLIDGASVGDVDNTVLRERKILSDDGVVAVSVVLSRRTGDLLAPPVVHAMGFLYDSEYEQVIAECERRAIAFVQRAKHHHQNPGESIRSGQMRDQLRTFLFEKTRRRPVVMVAVSEVEPR
ncbi:MAG: ribonuclease J [Oscillospiraceae bacterium]|nr:ribonuclease J [Oscillospiraceae bacterium]